MRTFLAVLAAIAIAYLLLGQSSGVMKSPTRNDVPNPVVHIAKGNSRPSVQRHPESNLGSDDPLIQPIDLGVQSPDVPSVLPTTFNLGDHATFHPHGGEVCASGCAASRHPTEKLSPDKFNDLIDRYAAESFVDAGPALDELLYFGRQTAQLLDESDRQSLDPIRYAILKNEVARDHAIVEICVVDSLGQDRATLPPTKVPLDRRHEFELDTHDLQPMIASGTVKRVGRDYAWTRM